MARRLFAYRAQQAMAIMSDYTNLRSLPFPVPIGAKIVPFMAWVLLSQKNGWKQPEIKKPKDFLFREKIGNPFLLQKRLKWQ